MPPDAHGTIPEAVARLLEVVDTLEKLELIKRFHRHRDAACRPAEAAAEIGLGRDEVTEALTELVAAGLLSRDAGGGYWYAPRHGALDAAVADLVRLYDTERLAILRAITEAAFDRIRNSAARTFADAFVIRRRPKPEEPNDG